MPDTLAGQVGTHYDNQIDAAPPGGNLHFGYWDDETADPDFDAATDRLTGLVLAALGVSAGSRVIDIGCGVGGPALRLARETGAHVTASPSAANKPRPPAPAPPSST
jgi:cyclopropane fatty-acyl-phospholipid synthase-like methyltransferase